MENEPNDAPKKRAQKTGTELSIHVMQLCLRNLKKLDIESQETVTRHLNEHVANERRRQNREMMMTAQRQREPQQGLINQAQNPDQGAPPNGRSNSFE